MKLNKTQAKLLEWLYNEHLESCLLKKFNEVNAALQLASLYPDRFSCERSGFDGVRSTYNFTIKRLGMVPEYMKGFLK